MTENNLGYGLSSSEAQSRQAKFGKNEIAKTKKQNFILRLIKVILEPMFVLLIIAASIYFILGEPKDGAIMLVFVFAVIAIEAIQEWKTDKTLRALKSLAAPKIKVIRDGIEKTIMSEDLVPGDVMSIEEGVKIPADGFVLKSFDLSVDESTLTGESEAVFKNAVANGRGVSDVLNEVDCKFEIDAKNAELISKTDGAGSNAETAVKDAESRDNKDYWRKDYVYAGTFVTLGSALIEVGKIGVDTEYGKIGQKLASVKESPTPLKKQTAKLVKLCAGIAAVLFALVSAITFLSLDESDGRLITSILSGISLAMAMIPEEFPVILTVFLSLGAWRLAKKQSLVKRLPKVETLGAVSVICVDKTGTLTVNQMKVTKADSFIGSMSELHKLMALSCEEDVYDPMEKAINEYCSQFDELNSFDKGAQVFEYPFTNKLKMMAHVYSGNSLCGGGKLVAAKGSPERILSLCDMSSEFRSKVESRLEEWAANGLRVIAVAKKHMNSDYELPKDVTELKLEFAGLIALSDPPREGIDKQIARLNKAGVRVVMMTGDNAVTAAAIAKRVGICADKSISGDVLDKMTDGELIEAVADTSVFARVIPEHKLRIAQALQKRGNVVAVVGDGVNDAPALKCADIGIAMGKRGSEVTREAADLILLDDNFATVADTVKDGRRIYDNIVKAVGYVFSVHIPIALSALLAPLIGIMPYDVFLLPLHIVLLELIIDPTCSVVLERQPSEKDIMSRPPLSPSAKLVTKQSMFKAVMQGLIIFFASFGGYYVLARVYGDVLSARSFGLCVIIFSNLFLVIVNSSRTDSALFTLKTLIKDKLMWIVMALTVAFALVIVYTPINGFLKVAPLNFGLMLIALATAAAAVLWYELVKLIKRAKFKKSLKQSLEKASTESSTAE